LQSPIEKSAYTKRWVRTRLLVGLIISLTITSFGQEPLAEQVPPAKKSPWGVVITIGLIAAGGAGGFLWYRKSEQRRSHADSVIAIVEHAWDSASALYEKEKYRAAILQLHQITATWHEYDKSIKRYRHRHHVDPDSIRSVIASCDFLESMITTVRALGDSAEKLPSDEYALTTMTRHELTSRKAFLRSAIDSIYATNLNHESALRYSLRHIENRLATVDSLVDASYLQQKSDFEIKNRFYYNQAIESGDTVALRQFVDNCAYYKVGKEWCERARLALGGGGGAVALGGTAARPMTVTDSIKMHFDRAIGSRKVEDLESYITMYSTRTYRRYNKYLRISEMKAALRQLKMTIDRQVAFNKEYPRLGVSNVGDITLTIKGLSGADESLFLQVWKRFEREMARLPQVRLPARLTVDYSTEPPLIGFEAVVEPATDITTTTINDRPAYHIESVVPVMKILNTLKNGVVETLLQERAGNTRDRMVQYRVNKLAFAAYTVRLNKPGNSGMIMFYAKENRSAGADTAQSFTFYEFYDIAASGYKTARFSIYPTSISTMIPSLSSDPLEQKMGALFFSQQ